MLLVLQLNLLLAEAGEEEEVVEEVISDVTPAGRKRKRKRERKLVVDIDGQQFIVKSVAEAQKLLNGAVSVEKERVDSAPLDVKKVAVKAGVPSVKTGSKVLQSVVADAQQQLNEIHRDRVADLQMHQEISILMHKQMEREQEEEDAIILLLAS